MKKILSLILAIVMLLSLSGCAEILGIVLDVGLGYLETTGATEESTQPSTTVEPTDPTETESTVPTTQAPTEEPTETPIDEDGWYYSKEDVSLYLYTYGHLPSNFITKNQARALGWSGGSVERYKEGAAIGGDKFSNREGLLPRASGRQYYECDIDTNGKSSRGAKRIVFSNDGLIYYTDDHYENFTLLYGGE